MPEPVVLEAAVLGKAAHEGQNRTHQVFGNAGAVAAGHIAQLTLLQIAAADKLIHTRPCGLHPLQMLTKAQIFRRHIAQDDVGRPQILLIDRRRIVWGAEYKLAPLPCQLAEFFAICFIKGHK